MALSRYLRLPDVSITPFKGILWSEDWLLFELAFDRTISRFEKEWTNKQMEKILEAIFEKHLQMV